MMKNLLEKILSVLLTRLGMPILIVLTTALMSGNAFAQLSDTPRPLLLKNLSKRVTLTADKEKLGDVLNKISKEGNFYFSYSGGLFHPDSLVSLQVRNMPVRDLLESLFQGKVDYKENGDYIILRYAVLHFTIEPETITYTNRQYVISGHVVDLETGRKVNQASIYEKRLLQSVLTDHNGYFRLRFKGDHQQVILTASKEAYRDTSLVFLADIKIRPEGYTDEYGNGGFVISNLIEASGIGRFLTSSAQRIQSMNIPGFFANSPFQASLLPGLSSHGMMSAQVVNKASLNVLGGYTAGVNGVELAGLFNLNKGNVGPVQVAGLLNGVGGSTQGVQMAGLVNSVYQNTKGAQVAGMFNHVRKDVNAIQAAGLGNIVSGNLNGVQIAGIGSIVSKTMKGAQISAVFNYAGHMRGFQLGLVNIADSSSGYSLGLLNLVKKHGYHKVSLSANDIMNANIAFKTGNSRLYTMLIGGINYSDTAKVESFGLGFGHDILLGKSVSVAAELSAQYLHLGNWDYANILNKAAVNLQIRLFRGVSIFGGPAYNIYISEAPAGSSSANYKEQIAPDKHHYFNRTTRGWLGWNAGITLF